MFSEIIQLLREWSELNTAIALTAALAAMSCALPGIWLVLRRQSMLADALAHAALPGVVGGFLSAYAAKSWGLTTADSFDVVLGLAVTTGAIVAGLLTAWLTEAVQQLGRMDNGAALGVVFTCLFAGGLVLIRLTADDVHLDPDCVLFGILEATALDTVTPSSWLPQAAVTNGLVLLVNLGLTILFFKELRLAAFDPEMARSQGIPATALHYILLAATAAAAATAFSTVGSILVIGLLIIPAVIARFLTDRLGILVVLTLAIAALCAVLGHAAAMSIAGPVFTRLGFTAVRDANTAGSIAVVAGFLFATVVFLAPHQGLVMRTIDRWKVAVQITADDVLGELYRRDEGRRMIVSPLARTSSLLRSAAIRRLLHRGEISPDDRGEYKLSPTGLTAARELVRTHRLWESYLDQNFSLPADQLHLAADRAEHFLDPSLRKELAAEVPLASIDPHGRNIPEAPPRPER